MSALPLHDYHPTTTKLLLIILVTLTAAFTTAPKAYSATIPLGSVTQVSQPPYPCGSTFYPGMLCFDATVVCPSTDNINVTFGYTGPTQLTTPLGTIVFFSGGTGTTPAAPGEDLTAYSDEYVKKYRIVQIAWESAWEKATASGAQSILLAACRPATLLKWINDSAAVHPAGAMCAQGKSAGSGAIAYAMSWYGAGGYLKNVELLAGPVFSKIDDGCNPTPPTVSMCPSGGICTPGTTSWSRSAGYTSDKATAINAWSGLAKCTQSSVNSGDLQTWAGMSIVNGSYSGVSPVFTFSGTKRHGWICAGNNTNYDNWAADCPNNNAFCPNNSSPQGYDWYAAATDGNLKVSGTNQCDGTTNSTTSTEAEGVDGTNAKDPDATSTPEKTAIQNDMTSNCL